MRFSLLWLVIPALILAACGPSAAESGVAPHGRAHVGARLFAQDRCVECHIVNGVGGTRGPELTHNPVAADYQSLQRTLGDPPSPMAFVKDLHLSDQQIADLSAFTDSSLTAKRSSR